MSDQEYIGTITNIFERYGPGGGLTLVQVELKDIGRTLSRLIKGSVKLGDQVVLLDCEREYKRGRF